jgi:glyoxylase-like metal-dependent hydrolase (beta-lactamase superfamily II)
MVKIQLFVFNPLQENTFVLFDETNECVIIDPGCCDESERYELADFIIENNLKVKYLLNTHCHVDHVLGNYFVKEKFKVPLLIHEKDQATLKAVKAYAPHYGFFQYDDTEADGYLKEGDTVKFGNQTLSVLFVPGHAPGHIAFHDTANQFVIGGDVLFYNSIGRTDLPGGDFETLIHSIQQKFFTLPEDTVVYPGHGPETTIGFEKKTNPFCAVEA